MTIYKEYHLCLSDGVTDHTLVYDLELHRPAQLWAEIMSNIDVSSLRENFDPWHGLCAPVKELINRLSELIDNLSLPVTLPPNAWEVEVQELLNKLHVHFPELEHYEKDVQRKQWLTEYNDIIHRLEDIDRNQTGLIWLALLPHSDSEYELLDSDYELFSASRQFGDLCLHYPHVGRHLLELLKSKDIDCPIDQVVPQSKIKAYHTLRFYDDSYSEAEYKSFLKMFLDNSKLGKLYNSEDPKLAFGYVNLGKLRYTDKEATLAILRNTHFVKSWKIVA